MGGCKHVLLIFKEDQLANVKGGKTDQAPAVNGGRALSCAEIETGGHYVALEPASMGPRTLVRGNKRSPSSTKSMNALQWGRALSCAEMLPRTRSLWRRCASFNGAAHSRARKCLVTAAEGIFEVAA